MRYAFNLKQGARTDRGCGRPNLNRDCHRRSKGRTRTEYCSRSA